ncbi:hypothetical protein Tco_1191127 [Tanacetum coccineum]
MLHHLMLNQSLLLHHHLNPKRPKNIGKLKERPLRYLSLRGDSVERVATITTSLDAQQGSGNINRTQSTTTLNQPIPQGTSSGSGPRCQDTIGDRSAQTRFDRLSKQSNKLPLLRVYTLGIGEDSMKLQELMDLYTKLSNRVLDLENVKDAQALEIQKLKKRVKKLESKKKSRTPQLKRRLFKVRIESSTKKSLEDSETQRSAPITTAGVSVNTAEPSTLPPTTIITLIEDEDLTIA